MSQKLAVNGSKWVKQQNNQNLIKTSLKKFDENSNTGYFLEVDIDYPKTLFDFHKNLSFLGERKKVEKVEKHLQHRRQRKMCYSHKSFKTSIKSWVKTKKTYTKQLSLNKKRC